MSKPTLEDIAAIDKEFLTPADVASYVGVDPESIRKAAEKGTLRWAYKIGTRTKIPKQRFIQEHTTGAPQYVIGTDLGKLREMFQEYDDMRERIKRGEA